MRDWADERTDEIFAWIVAHGDTPTVRALIASKLRIVWQEGRGDGIGATVRIVDEMFAKYNKPGTAP